MYLQRAMLPSALREALFAEPTVYGLCGAVALHMSTWVVLHSWEWGLMKYVRQAVQKLLPYKTIQSNFEGDATVELFGMEKDPGLVYVWNIGTCLHHFVGGVLSFAGWYYGIPWLWRHGMCVEVGGLDLLDLGLRLPWVLFKPPGPFPTASLVKEDGSVAPYFYLQVFHHTVGMYVGIVTMIYFSHLPDFQWLAVILLGM